MGKFYFFLLLFAQVNRVFGNPFFGNPLLFICFYHYSLFLSLLFYFYFYFLFMFKIKISSNQDAYRRIAYSTNLRAHLVWGQ